MWGGEVGTVLTVWVREWWGGDSLGCRAEGVVQSSCKVEGSNPTSVVDGVDQVLPVE